MNKKFMAAALTAALSVSAMPALAQTPAESPASTSHAATLPNGQAIAPCLTPTEDMACIPGGKFIRGADSDDHNMHCKQSSYNDKHHPNNGPAAEIWMQTFYMDKTEVTTEAYKACVKAGKCVKSGPKYVDFDRPKQPITGISWYEANDYCKAQGKHLPSEAEWEKAARGPDGDLYPWGNEPKPNCENSVIMDDKLGRSCGVQKRGKNPEKGRVLEVCSRPAYRYGLCDMVGNAEEWVADWYTNGYGECGSECLGVDPKGPCAGSADEKCVDKAVADNCKKLQAEDAANGTKKRRCGDLRYKVVKGGSWYWTIDHATAYHRRSHVPSNNPGHHFGFRCAASQEEMNNLLK